MRPVDRACLDALRVPFITTLDDGRAVAFVELLGRTSLLYTREAGEWGTADFTGEWRPATALVAQKLDEAWA